MTLQVKRRLAGRELRLMCDAEIAARLAEFRAQFEAERGWFTETDVDAVLARRAAGEDTTDFVTKLSAQRTLERERGSYDVTETLLEVLRIGLANLPAPQAIYRTDAEFEKALKDALRSAR